MAGARDAHRLRGERSRRVERPAHGGRAPHRRDGVFVGVDDVQCRRPSTNGALCEPDGPVDRSRVTRDRAGRIVGVTHGDSTQAYAYDARGRVTGIRSESPGFRDETLVSYGCPSSARSARRSAPPSCGGRRAHASRVVGADFCRAQRPAHAVIEEPAARGLEPRSLSAPARARSNGRRAARGCARRSAPPPARRTHRRPRRA